MNVEARVAPAPFARFLSSENEVIRSAAIRALSKLTDMPDDARPTLLASLLDEDPDVRCDAMEALIPLARSEDGPSLLRSLEGDPVREVKLAAIAALAKVRASASVPLLRALATSRAEDRVAWEDDIGDWDEWLDVQTAAIKALGDMGAVEAVDDLIDALFDELGQKVDDHVFAAFGKMGDHGIGVLLETFRQTQGVTQRRAAAALARIAPEGLRAYLDDLLRAESLELRRLGLKNLPAEDARCRAMALSEVDPSLRADALGKAADVDPGLVQEALSDTDARVKAVALSHLALPLETEFEATLVDNMLIWLDTAEAPLGQAICEKLVALAPDRALEPLLGLLDDRTRALELRVAAAKHLAAPALQTSLDVIAAQLQNPAHQVRAAVLTVLRARLELEDAAMALVTSLIAGTFEIDAAEQPEEARYEDVGTPKEGAGPRNIEITPDGEIVERTDAAAAAPNSSTLAVLLGQQETAAPPKLAEDTPEETGAKRAKRRPVEGSDDLAHSLAQDALTLFADVPGEDMTNAIADRLSDRDDTLRRAAWRAMVGRPMDDATRAAAKAACQDADPIVRMAALQICLSDPTPDLLEEALADRDPLIRAEVLAHVPVEKVHAYVGDPAPVVRAAAVDRLLADGDAQSLQSAVEAAIRAEASDVIRRLSEHKGALLRIRSRLAEAGTSDRDALIILRGLDG